MSTAASRVNLHFTGLTAIHFEQQNAILILATILSCIILDAVRRYSVEAEEGMCTIFKVLQSRVENRGCVSH